MVTRLATISESSVCAELDKMFCMHYPSKPSQNLRVNAVVFDSVYMEALAQVEAGFPALAPLRLQCIAVDKSSTCVA